MTDQFDLMRNLIHIYFGMDYDIFGDNVDEILREYSYSNGLDISDSIIEELRKYIKIHSDDTEDIFFKKKFGYCDFYTSDYDNSVEFLKDVLNKIIFYRDQLLREEAAKKDA